MSRFMARALRLACRARDLGEVPVAALIYGPDARLVAAGVNSCFRDSDPTQHAEMIALNRAFARLKDPHKKGRLAGHTIWVTLEPCPMCSAAIALARPARLVFAARDPKSGGALSGPALLASKQHKLPYPPIEIVEGIMENEALDLLKDFFIDLRAKKKAKN